MTTIALRHERRKNSITIPVKRMPSASVCQTALICCCVYVACTLRTAKLMAGYSARSRGSALTPFSAAATSLAPVVFCALSVMATLGRRTNRSAALRTSR